MPGFNWLGMLINAYFRDDAPDQFRIRYFFGWFTPFGKIDHRGKRVPNVDQFTARKAQFIQVITHFRVHKWWHVTKGLAVEYTRMEVQRGVKLGMDLIVWTGVCWLLIGLLLG